MRKTGPSWTPGRSSPALPLGSLRWAPTQLGPGPGRDQVLGPLWAGSSDLDAGLSGATQGLQNTHLNLFLLPKMRELNQVSLSSPPTGGPCESLAALC